MGLCAALLCGLPSIAMADTKPNMRHGLGQVVGGLVLELPKTVIDATFSNPPVVGTAIGLLAGTIGALQKTIGGLVEMAQAFKPLDW